MFKWKAYLFVYSLKTELQQLKEKLDIEKESWEQNFLKKQVC